MRILRIARRGFTLIEIMVVVIVLGILAAVVIPNFVGQTDEARVAKARSDISNFTTMIEQFRLHMRRYPFADEGLDVLRNPPNSQDANNWKGPYLRKAVPKDPWGNAYVYMEPAPNGIDPYGVVSYGADGAPGGEDLNRDITSWEDYEDSEQ